MADAHYYGNLIWTNHVLDRLKERGLSQEMVWRAVQNPDRSFSGRENGSMHYERKNDSHTITVILKKNQRNENVVISAWMDPPLAGTKDAQKKQSYWEYQKAPEWKKWLLSFKKMLGW